VDPAGRDRLPVTFAEPTVAIEHCSDDRKWIESLVQGSTSTGRFLSSSQQDLAYSLTSLKADDPTSNYRSALRLHKHEFCSTVRCLVTKIFSELEALLPPAWQKSISSLRRDESTRTLPFLNAFSAVHALFRLDGNRNYGRGDGYDAQHAAFGLAYFDVLLVDKSLGHLLRTGPLHLDTLFNVRVARSPADAIRLMNESR